MQKPDPLAGPRGLSDGPAKLSCIRGNSVAEATPLKTSARNALIEGDGRLMRHPGKLAATDHRPRQQVLDGGAEPGLVVGVEHPQVDADDGEPGGGPLGGGARGPGLRQRAGERGRPPRAPSGCRRCRRGRSGPALPPWSREPTGRAEGRRGEQGRPAQALSLASGSDPDRRLALLAKAYAWPEFDLSVSV